MATVEEKSMVPTVIIGVGGTGAEILARVRRLVEETYGSLKNFPIISFLLIDTDKDYKIASPEAGGTPLKDKEKHWARVGGRQVNEMLADMDNYPWINSWFPNELERNLTSLEAGAGQIRACGRFALFCNYHAIRDKFREAVSRIKGKENFMLDRYQMKVNTNAINVFVTGSLSGGTGSGMLIDIGYCVRDWIKEEGTPTVTALAPMPNAFAGISVGDRVLANGYAAMMELSYFSDYRTEYAVQFSNNLSDEIRSNRPPFDFTYLVGTKNGESDFTLEQIREAIAQNIFLDMTSDFSPHKRSIRDNIKGSWAAADPGGRGYPKNFMSFGLSTIEIPIAHIRMSLANRLAKDLIGWWLNESVQLPPQMLDLVRGDLLKKMRLTEAELIADVSSAQDRPYLQVVSQWVNDIRNEIATENWLQCTQQGVNMMGSERGKILDFIGEYLQPKVDSYRADHFRELSPDERLHGDYLQRMYNNRDESIRRGRKALDEEFYAMLSDRTRGPKFADAFIVTVRQVFNDMEEKFRRERDSIWSSKEVERQEQYERALADINEFKQKFGVTKQSKMEEYSESALNGLEGSLVATIQRKARDLALDTIAQLRDHLVMLERRFNRYVQRLTIARDYFQNQGRQDADGADALVVNGIKLYDRNELNNLYQDLIEQFAGASESNKSEYQRGLDSLCSTLSDDILQQASPLWKQTRRADEVMQLFDITEIPDVEEEDLREIIFERNKQVIDYAPENSRVRKDLAACDRLFKLYNDNAEITNNLRIAYNKSQPFIRINTAITSGKDAGFTPAKNINVALLGGRNTTDPAAQKMLPLIKEFVGNEEDIKPLGEPERYRIVFVQEMGGFSLRAIDGMRELRQSYQDWRGQSIVAKRAQLKGESRDLPIPVHIQKEPPFWDIFPEDPTIFKLVVLCRALGVLRLERNQRTKENAVRYVRQTAIGAENVDLASSWEEVAQVLEVDACRQDRQECDRQSKQILTSAETPQQKQVLFQQFLDYLASRALEVQGGKDSPEYKRESTIILDAIEQYELKTEEREPVLEKESPKVIDAVLVPPPELQPQDDPIPATPPVTETKAAPATQKSDLMAQLKQLANFKEQGVLSEEEFQAAKRKLLGL